MPLIKDSNHLEVYLEGRKRRTFVGTLSYNEEQDTFQFQYETKYVKSLKAIPIGPDLSIFKRKHISEKGKLFPSFADRIPSRSNPAYEEYCRSQGIAIDERNPIVLLGTIGRRGPSSFVFEPVVQNSFSQDEIVSFRKTLNLTLNELAIAFDINEQTLQRVESKKSKDQHTLKRMQIYFEFPEVALWELESNGSKLNHQAYGKLKVYFEKQLDKGSSKKTNTKNKNSKSSLSSGVTVGALCRDLSLYNKNAEVIFGGDESLTFYRVKPRGEDLVQIEFNEI
ncbi:MAG TPA: hypothetical protein VIG33_06310 [Pseudobdellovibrionaceae bacterium]